MATVDAESAAATDYDVIVVGGGTAGCVLGARLSEKPDRRVAVVEGGPSDVGDDNVLQIRNWINLLESEYDYGYRTTPQPRGNSHIVHSRAKVLGGCSSHNTMISFRPLPSDLDSWAEDGAQGWDYAAMRPYLDRVQVRYTQAAAEDRNPMAADFITAATSATGVPEVEDFNAEPFTEGAGWLSIGYDPSTGRRNSSSASYLHDVLGRENLHLIPSTRVMRVELEGSRAVGVRVRDESGGSAMLRLAPGGEVVLSAGAVDTPRLLLLSGIGAGEQLRPLGIETAVEVPGVGENLLDHPESIILWEASRPLPPQAVMDSDAGLFLRRDASEPGPDLMYHLYMLPFTLNTERLGYPVPEHGFGLTPNIPRPRSVGRLSLASADPEAHPLLDFRYFTDPKGYDERTIVDGIKIAREIAATPPFSDWIAREIAPGPDVTTDEGLSSFGRAAHHTVYHPAGTCRMGSEEDEYAVVDPQLRVRGIEGLRVADASIFPSMPSVNPMITVLAVGERAAAMIAGE